MPRFGHIRSKSYIRSRVLCSESFEALTLYAMQARSDQLLLFEQDRTRKAKVLAASLVDCYALLDCFIKLKGGLKVLPYVEVFHDSVARSGKYRFHRFRVPSLPWLVINTDYT